MSGKPHAGKSSNSTTENDGTPAADGVTGSTGEELQAPTVNMISLGCPKNLVDSEVMLGKAGLAGFRLSPSPEEADIVIVNTCGFIGEAKEESVDTILDVCELKKTSTTPKKIVVAGCLGQRYGEELRAEIPEIDAIVGLGEYGSIGEALIGLLASDSRADGTDLLYRVGDPNFACNAETGRLRLTPRHYGYVRISEGCDNPCTFCAIPKIRGRFRSKPLPMILEEVRELAESGSKEIVVISQDTTSYGVDLDGTYQLPRLLEAISSVEGIEWIRILYVYPAGFSDAMIDAIASIPKVLKYVDIPLQHITDAMLRRMGRRLDERRTRALLERMRQRIAGLYLRTTFIVGFPGEEDHDFEQLRDFVSEFRFERLGAFRYSHEENTPAHRFKESVPDDVVSHRLEEVMLAQQKVAFEHNQSRIGESLQVILEQEEDTEWIARSHGEAPEIDPVIAIPKRQVLQSSSAWSAGQFVSVKVTGTRDYDLLAAPS